MMSTETIKSKIDVEDYFSKMTPENSAIIAIMCVEKLTHKVKELKDLYASLAKTYSFEMGIYDITCIAQISSNFLSPAALGMLGTDDGVNKGLNVLKTEAIKRGFKLDKEETKNEKKQC